MIGECAAARTWMVQSDRVLYIWTLDFPTDLEGGRVSWSISRKLPCTAVHMRIAPVAQALVRALH